MLVELPVTSSSPLKHAAPIAVERYDAETREYYGTERPDLLNFRVLDGQALTDHRFYHPGRADGIKQAIFTDVTGTSGIEVIFNGSRDDGVVHYSRQAKRESGTSSPDAFHTTYRVDYVLGKRKDGLKSISLALAPGARIDISCDTPSSIFNLKTLHLALTCNPDLHPGYVMEVYQDQTTRHLRLTYEEQSTLLPKTILYPNNEPTEDPLYEANKILLMEALVKILTVERELTLNLPYSADVEEQKKRLEELSTGLFAALDAIAPPVQI
jgi:hypothetical protein